VSAADATGATAGGARARLVKRPIGLVVAAVLAVGAALTWNQRGGVPTPLAEGHGLSIVVQPFRTIGGDVEPWSGLGLAQEVRAALDTVKGLQVRPAEGHGYVAADYLLTGSISRRDLRRDIGVELLRLRDRKVLWTGTYWRTASNLASFSTELAEAVVTAIRLDAKPANTSR
jgi:hypothetical protein